MKQLITILFIVMMGPNLFAQNLQVIDNVMAVVGSNIILRSDVEKQYYQSITQGESPSEQMKCYIFDQLIIQKLLVNQAAIDSVVISEAQVEGELDKRIRYFIKQIGSQEKLEEYFHTTIIQLKSEMRNLIRDQITVQTMQGKITKDVTATPNDVREYFASIPSDSLPYLPAEIELAQIVRKPPVSDAEKKAVKAQLEEYRKKIIEGADFAVYAALYSQDNATAKRGGELGFFERGAMQPEFEAAAFNLKTGEVSNVVETKFGYHILQLVERRGDQIDVRHILLQPKISDEDLKASVYFLDSLRRRIVAGSISFEDAAERFSNDEETRFNGGIMINPETGTTKLSPDRMERLLFFQVDTMPLGVISHPLLMTTSEGKSAYRLVIVKSRTQPHKANLRDDYQKIQEVTLTDKQSKAITEWVEKKRKTTYIQVNDDMNKCELLKHWTKGTN